MNQPPRVQRTQPQKAGSVVAAPVGAAIEFLKMPKFHGIREKFRQVARKAACRKLISVWIEEIYSTLTSRMAGTPAPSSGKINQR